MGMSAGVNVWYGVKFSYYEDDYELQENLLEESDKRSEEPPYDWIETQGGPVFQLIYASDGFEPVGFGVVLAYHDWDYQPILLEDFLIKADTHLNLVKDEADAVIDRFAPDKERRVWLHTQYW